MSIKWKFNYGIAAVALAVVVIAIALVANPTLIGLSLSPSAYPSTTPLANPSTNPDQISPASSFLVMLTDPPIVPDGTTQLNLTYSDISFYTIYPNGTAVWVPVDASGTVNLLSLVNMSQTLAATTIPTGSTVNKIQFTIADVKAVVNGETYSVTALSNSIVMTIGNSKINQTLSGVLIDFNPTLVQIQGEDTDGKEVNYYVLVPSATARIIGNLRREQCEVGTVVGLEEHHREELRERINEFSHNVTVTEASLIVNGNTTILSATIKNDGNRTFRVFGLTLHGEFNTTRVMEKIQGRQGQNYGDGAGNVGNGQSDRIIFEQIHPRTIPFKVDETSLIPLFGNNQGRCGEHRISLITIEPEETVTLTFSGVISLQQGRGHTDRITTITPLSDSDYTIRLMGEGFQTYNVTSMP